MLIPFLLADMSQLFMSHGDACGKRFAAMQWRHTGVRVADALLDDTDDIVQQGDHFAVSAHAVVDHFLDEFLCRLSDFCHGFDFRHAGTALEGVQGAVDAIIDRVFGNILVQTVQPGMYQCYVGVAFVTENLKQHRIGVVDFRDCHFRDRHIRHIQGLGAAGQCAVVEGDFFCVLGQPVWRRALVCFFEHASGSVDLIHPDDIRQHADATAGGKRVRRITERGNVVGVRFLRSESFHQRRHEAMHLAHQLHENRCWFDSLVNHPVHHVFDRPGQLTDRGRADHAARTFQRVESTAEFHQRFLILLVGCPTREVGIQGFQHFAGFFDKDFDDFIIDQVVIPVEGGGRRSGRRGGRRNRRRGRRRNRLGGTRDVVFGKIVAQDVKALVQRLTDLWAGLLRGGLQCDAVAIILLVGRRVGVIDRRQILGCAVVRVEALAVILAIVITATEFLIFQRIAQCGHAVAGQIKNAVTGVRVVRQALQEIFNTGNGVRQRVHAAPVRRYCIGTQQALADIRHTLAQDQCRTLQLDQLQATTHRVQARGYFFQM